MVPVEMYSFHISLQNVVIIFFILIIQLLPVLIGMMTDPAYRCFQFDKQPQFIAIFNELFCRRIMRGSDEVTVGSPIQFCIGLPFLIGQRTSVKRMSLMTADSSQLDRTAVDQQTVSPYFHFTEAEFFLNLCYGIFSFIQIQMKPVQVGMLIVPQQR